jgi:hypothetical protein
MKLLLSRRDWKVPNNSSNKSMAIHDGISATDYQRVQQWIAAGCPKTPDTAFTAGVARDAARLVAEALETDARAVAIAGGMIAASAMLCLTRQEMRMVQAVLEWRRSAIVKKAEEL